MSEVRLLVTGHVKDYDSAVAVFKQVADTAAELEETLIWDFFADEDTGVLVLDETFDSENALAEYQDAVMSRGLQAALSEVSVIEHLMIIGTIENEQMNHMLESMGAIRITLLASK